jgi:hypothetical protein
MVLKLPWIKDVDEPFLHNNHNRCATGGTLGQDSIQEIVTRWKVAEEYLSYLEIELLPPEHALRVLIRQDVPSLLKEVIRLRPDLA